MAKIETKEKVKKEATEKMKYGVEDVAKLLEIEPASARVQLRNHNIKKAGKSYGWNTKEEVAEVAKKVRSESTSKPKPVAKLVKKPEAKKAEVKKVEKKVAAS